MLANLSRCTMSLGAETAQQLHHVVVMFRRRITDAEDPVEQVGVRAIEQHLESPELIAIQHVDGVLGERTEDEIALLRPAMPAPKQEAPAADVAMIKNIFRLCRRSHREPMLLRRVSVLHTGIYRECRWSSLKRLLSLERICFFLKSAGLIH